MLTQNRNQYLNKNIQKKQESCMNLERKISCNQPNTRLSIKNHSQIMKNTFVLQKSNSKQFCRAYLKEYQSSHKKSKTKNQESSDYIKNLYKKYLGKENTPQQKVIKSQAKTRTKKYNLTERDVVHGVANKSNQNHYHTNGKKLSKISSISQVSVQKQKNKSAQKQHDLSISGRLTKRSQSQHSIQNNQFVLNKNDKSKIPLKQQISKKLNFQNMRDQGQLIQKSKILSKQRSIYQYQKQRNSEPTNYNLDRSDMKSRHSSKQRQRPISRDQNLRKVKRKEISIIENLNRNFYCQFSTQQEEKVRQNYTQSKQKNNFFLQKNTQMLSLIVDNNSSMFKALAKINKVKYSMSERGRNKI